MSRNERLNRDTMEKLQTMPLQCNRYKTIYLHSLEVHPSLPAPVRSTGTPSMDTKKKVSKTGGSGV